MWLRKKLEIATGAVKGRGWEEVAEKLDVAWIGGAALPALR
jgi:hypothetical protein